MFSVLYVFSIILSIILHTTSADEDSSCPNIISRSQWRAKTAKFDNFLIPPLQYVVIHHTATPECETRSQCSNRVKNIQSYHMDELNWTDIGYSFLIGGDGNVYEGVGWTKEGAHTYGYNKKSAGLAFIGSYEDKKASEKMLTAAHKLILCGKSEGALRPDVKVIAGRQVVSIISPGMELYNQIQNWPEWASEV